MKGLQRIIRLQDFWIGVIILIICAALIPSTTIIKGDAKIYPSVSLGFTAFCGMLLIIYSIVKRDKTDTKKKKTTLSDFLYEVVIPGIILFTVAVLLEHLGFPICSFILVFVVSIYQKVNQEGFHQLTGRFIFMKFLFALAVAVLVYLVFTVALHLPTPKGIFGF